MTTKLINYYELNTPNYTYYTNVLIEHNMFNKPVKIVFNLDRCVTISVSPLENIGILEQVYYEDMYKVLENGIGTRDMLHGSLSLVKKLFPNITGFKLRDASYKPSDDNISLFHLYISLHGKTWYEQYFNAVFIGTNEEHKTKYIQCISKMNNSEFKSSISLDYFQTNIVGHFFTKDIQLLYNKSITFLDFFNLVFNICNKKYKDYIKFIKPWIENFINIFIFEKDSYLVNENYMISDDKLEYIDKINYILIDEIPIENRIGGENKKYNLFYRYSLW